MLQLARPLRFDYPESQAFMERKLAESGLVPEDLNAYPVAPLGMSKIPGFLIPYNDLNMYRIRYDRLVDKYIGPKGHVGVWWSPKLDLADFRFAPTLYIVEGELKAAAMQKRFPMLKVLGIGGCWMFKDKHSTIPKLMPDILRAVAPNQKVHVIFDGDIQEKVNIQQAAHALNGLLQVQGCEVTIQRPPDGKGADDWLVAHPEAVLSDLITIPLENLEISKKQLYKQLGLQTNDKDKIILNEFNASKLLAYTYEGNTYRDKRLGMIANGTRLEGDPGLEALMYLQENVSPHWSKHAAQSGFAIAIERTERDVVQEMVRATQWDGVKRLNTWGAEYFECNWPAQAAEWGRLLVTGLGLRILRPGTKVDLCCILVGAQGIGKSTFFESLSHFGGFDFYHACTALSTSEGDVARTQVTSFKRSVIVDLAEGVVFNNKKSNTDTIKQVISQVADEYREVFAKYNSVIPRGFIFVGTTNRRDQLSDLTGSRRFLNLEVTKIKRLDYEFKMQLLAEVCANEDAIRNTTWYELNLDINDAPAELREEHGHITNAQELINTQFHKAEAINDIILDLVDSGNTATAGQRGGTPKPFLTARYVSLCMGIDSSQNVNLVSRMLSQMSSSPTCKYAIAFYKPRVPQLSFKSNEQKSYYLGGYDDDKRMLSGYTFTAR